MKMYQSFRFVVASALIGFSVSSTAVVAGDSACAADVKKYCAQVKPGGGAVSKCLTEHENELTPACREQTKKAAEVLTQFDQACGEDAKKLCADVAPGGGRVVSCLGKSYDKISKPCQEALTALKKRQ